MSLLAYWTALCIVLFQIFSVKNQNVVEVTLHNERYLLLDMTSEQNEILKKSEKLKGEPVITKELRFGICEQIFKNNGLEFESSARMKVRSFILIV